MRDVPFARPVTYCATGDVSAAIDNVFAVLTNPARMPEWLPGCGGAVSDDPIRPGVHIRTHFRSRVTEFVVVDYAPPFRFGWTERGQRKGWRLWFRLNAGTNETALTICEVWAPMSFGAWVWGNLIRRRHPERHVEQILEHLRRIFQWGREAFHDDRAPDRASRSESSSRRVRVITLFIRVAGILEGLTVARGRRAIADSLGHGGVHAGAAADATG